MNNYLISIVDIDDPLTPLFYRVQGNTIDEAKDFFIQKAFKALYDFNFDWDVVEDILNSRSIDMAITNEDAITSLV